MDDFEDRVLVAVSTLGPNATGVAIRDWLAERMKDRDLPNAQVYGACLSLERSGRIERVVATNNRRKSYWRLTGKRDYTESLVGMPSPA
jgi:hypothetical protein